MTEMPSIQWFPGHMAKTRRLIRESLSLVDCVAEVLDARIPISSRNPEFDALCAGKPRVLVLNKSDLADAQATKSWLAAFRAEGLCAIAVDCKSGAGIKEFVPAVRELLSERLERLKAKGMSGKALRVMVAGIPNSGKSTFINRIAGAKYAKAEDRPGVTRGRQWISIGLGLELLDMPGILWPKFENAAVGEHLAFTGAIKDDILDTELLAARLCEELAKNYASMLSVRYKLSGELPTQGGQLLEMIGKHRGMLAAGGRVDTERAAAVLLDEFRGGILGRITLERSTKGS
ncbi:MAG: ribosome biogenesis GTPase YlqF [Clostridia bacterium]|nr:ribosome biogenesis GTPase YlqF [Clostridia bacterium]MDR3644634.1 ribosome biogenesis GTPase YlqF [Clostridia bacterium]